MFYFESAKLLLYKLPKSKGYVNFRIFIKTIKSFVPLTKILDKRKHLKSNS